MSDNSFEARVRARQAEAERAAIEARRPHQEHLARMAQLDVQGRKNGDEFRKYMRTQNIPPTPIYGSSYTHVGYQNRRVYEFWFLGLSGWRLNVDNDADAGDRQYALLMDSTIVRIAVFGNPRYPKKMGIRGTRGVRAQAILCTPKPLTFEDQRICSDADFMADAATRCLQAGSGLW